VELTTSEDRAGEVAASAAAAAADDDDDNDDDVGADGRAGELLDRNESSFLVLSLNRPISPPDDEGAATAAVAAASPAPDISCVADPRRCALLCVVESKSCVL
jgi:hypothetical protein